MDHNFKAIEAIFSTRYGVKPEYAIAFRGRLQHLQRLGFPGGVNTGRGKRASYGWEQFVQLSLALDLIDIGFSPETAANLVARETPNILLIVRGIAGFFDDNDALVDAVEREKCPLDKTIIIVSSAHALSGLNDDGQAALQSLSIISGESFISRLEGDNPYTGAEAFVDMASRLLLTMNITCKLSYMPVEELVQDFVNWCGQHDINS